MAMMLIVMNRRTIDDHEDNNHYDYEDSDDDDEGVYKKTFYIFFRQTEGQYRVGVSRPPLLRQGSGSSASALYNSAAHAGAFIGLARAKLDFTPPEGDTDSLTYKVCFCTVNSKTLNYLI
jgi:hypothetical protein